MTVVVTVKLFCDASMLFCCEIGLIVVGVGVLDQRGGGAGGVLIGSRLRVFGGVGRGALTKLLPVAVAAAKGGATLRLSTISRELFALPVGDVTKLCVARQFV